MGGIDTLWPHMSFHRRIAGILGAAALAIGLAACGDDEEKSADKDVKAPIGAQLPCSDEKVKLNPTDFAEKVDNPYFPIEKGTRWSYKGSDSEGTTSSSDVVATGATRKIAGITAHALRDRSKEDGKLIEIATEWYAQDKKGNVWYLGETVRDFESGAGGATEGSLYGDGPFQAGVTMLGKPIPGSCHRLAYEKGQTEDRLAVLSVKERVRVPAGTYTGAVKLKQTTPLEEDLIENRYYAKGVGLVKVQAESGEAEKVELVKFSRGG